MHEPDQQTSQAAAAEAPPQPKSAYQLPTKQNMHLRNIMWAIGLTMAVVVVVAIGFFGVGSDLERETLANSAVDVDESAQRAQDLAPFPVAVPAMGQDWVERSARFADGASPRWTVEYTSPGGELVTLTEEAEVSPALLSATMPGARVQEELTIEGADCRLLSGGEQSDGDVALACQGEDWGIVVDGTVQRTVLEELAAGAITSLD